MQEPCQVAAWRGIFLCSFDLTIHRDTLHVWSRMVPYIALRYMYGHVWLPYIVTYGAIHIV